MDGMSVNHRISVEDGYLYLVIDGVLQESDMAAIIAFGDRFVESGQRYWMLVDVTGMTSMTVGARRMAATNPSAPFFLGAAVFGTTLLTKTLISLVTRALLLLGQTHIRLQFVDTAEQGRQWIALQLAKDPLRQA